MICSLLLYFLLGSSKPHIIQCHNDKSLIIDHVRLKKRFCLWYEKLQHCFGSSNYSTALETTQNACFSKCLWPNEHLNSDGVRHDSNHTLLRQAYDANLAAWSGTEVFDRNLLSRHKTWIFSFLIHYCKTSDTRWPVCWLLSSNSMNQKKNPTDYRVFTKIDLI